eukprot:1771272-Pyramimonas_sp.AAC.1
MANTSQVLAAELHHACYRIARETIRLHVVCLECVHFGVSNNTILECPLLFSRLWRSALGCGNFLILCALYYNNSAGYRYREHLGPALLKYISKEDQKT